MSRKKKVVQDKNTVIKKDLVDELMSATDSADINRLVDAFNLNIKKKELIRASKYNDLLDSITAQVEKRIKERPDGFSNKDLLSYLATIQSVLDSSVSSTVDTISSIQVTNNQFNISVEEPELDRNSMERIKNVVQSILSSAENPPILIEGNVVESEPVVDEAVSELQTEETPI